MVQWKLKPSLIYKIKKFDLIDALKELLDNLKRLTVSMTIIVYRQSFKIVTIVIISYIIIMCLYVFYVYALYNIKKWKSDQREFGRCTRKSVQSIFKFFFLILSISQKVHTNSTQLTNCQAKSKFSKYILVLVFFVFSTLSIRSNDYLATMKQYRQPISVKKKVQFLADHRIFHMLSQTILFSLSKKLSLIS